MEALSLWLELVTPNASISGKPAITTSQPLQSGNNDNVKQNSSFDFAWTPYVIISVAVTSILVLVTIFPNFLIIMSVLKYKRLQIPANYILINLAIADLGVGILSPLCLVMGLVVDYDDHAVMCMIPFCLVTILCSISLTSLGLVAYDRFSALVKPLTYGTKLTNVQIAFYCSVIWLYVTIVSICSFCAWLQSKTTPQSTADQSIDTWSFVNLGISSNIAVLIQFTLIFVPATLAIFYCYCRVMLVARHHARAISAVQGNLRQAKLNKSYGMFKGKKYFVTLTSIIGVFTCTWVLFIVIILTELFCTNCFKEFTIQRYAVLLVLLSSALNPWVYAYRGSDFKAAFCRLKKSFNVARKPDDRGRFQRRDSRLSDGLSRTNSIVGNNVQHLQLLYSEAYYNQKNENNNQSKSLVIIKSISKPVEQCKSQSDSC